MPGERIGTVVASLVEPTSHKEQKLQNLRSVYRETLCEAFDANAATMTAVNDIVAPYSLLYQAKDVLKHHVPDLLKNGSAELSETQPIRFINRATVFGHSTDRTYVFCWEIPQPGRGTNFWIPLAINPDQRKWGLQLLDGEATIGQL